MDLCRGQESLRFVYFAGREVHAIHSPLDSKEVFGETLAERCSESHCRRGTVLVTWVAARGKGWQ